MDWDHPDVDCFFVIGSKGDQLQCVGEDKTDHGRGGDGRLARQIARGTQGPGRFRGYLISISPLTLL